jgi:hypothetical protein
MDPDIHRLLQVLLRERPRVTELCVFFRLTGTGGWTYFFRLAREPDRLASLKTRITRRAGSDSHAPAF